MNHFKFLVKCQMTQKTLVLFFGFLSAFLICEVLFRLRKGELTHFENQIVRKVNQRPNPCLSQSDAKLGWKTVSNQSTWVPGKRNPKLKTFVSTQDFGIRSNGLDKALKGPAFLALGDSLTFGDEVSDTETWPSFLEQKLESPVLNAGACSYGVDQAYLRFLELDPLLNLKGVLLSITPVGIARTERKFMLTPFFKKMIPKPYFILLEDKLKGIEPEILDPHYNYNRLDWIRRILGYSYFFDFTFRKLAGHWWWALVPKEDYAPQFKTGFSGEKITCAILKDLGLKLKSKKQLGLVILQNYFNSEVKSGSFEEVSFCSKEYGFRVLDAQGELYKVREKDPSRYRTFWVRENGGHLSGQGNQEVAKMIFDTISPLPR